MLASSKWNAEKFPAGILKQQSMLMCFGPDGNGDGYWASSYTDCAINAAPKGRGQFSSILCVQESYPPASGQFPPDPIALLGHVMQSNNINAFASSDGPINALQTSRVKSQPGSY